MKEKKMYKKVEKKGSYIISPRCVSRLPAFQACIF